MTKQTIGSVEYPLHIRMRDTAEIHGWTWTLQHYSKRIPREEFRIIARVAYLYR